MRVIEFRYQVWKGKPIPIIPIRLYSHKISFKTYAFVDSGASYSIFEIDLLELLDLKVKQAIRKEMFVVGDGGFIPGWIFRLPVEIGDYKFRADIAFSDRLNVGFNLLGRKDIFEKFKEISFQEKRRLIIFKR
jgi:hypothetical protein